MWVYFVHNSYFNDWMWYYLSTAITIEMEKRKQYLNIKISKAWIMWTISKNILCKCLLSWWPSDRIYRLEKEQLE